MPDNKKLPLFKTHRPPLLSLPFSHIRPTPVQSSQSHTQSPLKILNFSPIPPPSPPSLTSPTPLSSSTPKKDDVADNSTPFSYSDDDEPKSSPTHTPPKNTP